MAQRAMVRAEHHPHTGEDAADGGTADRRTDGQAGLALLGQGVAVKGRGGVLRRTGDVEKDGHDGAAERTRAVHDAVDHQGLCRIKIGGEGQDDGTKSDDADARNGTEEETAKKCRKKIHYIYGVGEYPLYPLDDEIHTELL